MASSVNRQKSTSIVLTNEVTYSMEKTFKKILNNYLQSAVKEGEIKRWSKTINSSLLKLRKEGSFATDIFKICIDAKEKLETLDDFYCEFTHLDEIMSVMNDLLCDGTQNMPLQNKKRIHSYLMFVRSRMNIQTERLKKIISSFQNFHDNVSEIIFPKTIPVSRTAMRVLSMQKGHIIAMKLFIGYLLDIQTVSGFIFENVKKKIEETPIIFQNGVSSDIEEETEEMTDDASITSMAAQNKFDLFITKLKRISGEIEELIKKKETRKVSDLHLFEDEEICETEAVQYLNDVEKKVNMYEDFRHEFRVFYDHITSFVHYLISEGTNHMPLHNQKQIYSYLVIVRAGIKFLFNKLNLMKSIYEKSLNGIGNIEHAANPSHRDYAIDLERRQTSVIKELKEFITNFMNSHKLYSSVLKCLEKKLIDESPSEAADKSYFIRKKLEKISIQFKEVAIKEIEAKKVIELMHEEFQSLQNKGTGVEIRTFLNNIEGNIKMQEQFCDEIKPFFVELVSVKEHLMSEGISHLSHENQKHVDLDLRTVRLGIGFQKLRLNSIQFSCYRFLKNFDKIRFPINSLHFDTASNLSKRELALMNTINVFMKFIDDFEMISLIRINILKKAKTIELVSSRSEDSSKYDFLIEHLQNIPERLEELFFKGEEVREISDSLIEELQSVKNKEADESEFDQFLNDVERKVRMFQQFIFEFYMIYADMNMIVNYVLLGGSHHLSLENRTEVLCNLIYIHPRISCRVRELDRIKSSLEKFENDFDKISIPANFPHHQAAFAILKRFPTPAIRMEIVIQDLKTLDIDAVIERIKKETEVVIPSMVF
ncbi:hypothetical protein AVEN_179401-1 [Araneus ventricosus]|uniref:Uncharacterized protein n=1 Tax=Araneus ventricosus TaxID=182803 RepID=A0A4Y2BE30_ARAVE|nr:hypothetical protein AVEN_179401-1 [Araneus ventricosus]